MLQCLNNGSKQTLNNSYHSRKKKTTTINFTTKYIQINMKKIYNGCGINGIINKYFNYIFAFVLKIAKSIFYANLVKLYYPLHQSNK